jgi:hypothetical protein
VGVQKVWSRIRTRAGLADVRLHDLRHNLASVAAGSGESLFVTGTVLGHRTARSAKRYAHLADDPVRAAADRAGGRSLRASPEVTAAERRSAGGRPRRGKRAGDDDRARADTWP